RMKSHKAGGSVANCRTKEEVCNLHPSQAALQEVIMLLRFFRLSAFLLLTLLISQISASADSCPIESFRFNFSPPLVPVEGGTFQFGIFAPANCDWVATIPMSASWIRIDGPNSGKGTGSLTLIIAPNPGTFRSAPVFINGFPTVAIAQMGSAPCQ